MERKEEYIDRLVTARTALAGLAIFCIGIILLFVSEKGIYQSITFSLAMVFIPSGIISIIIDASIRKTFSTQVEHTLGDLLTKQFANISKLREYGFNDVYLGFPHDETREGIKNAKESICILHTWLPNVAAIEGALMSAVTSGCSVRILVMDETSVHVDERNKDLNGQENFALHNIRGSMAELTRLHKQLGCPSELSLEPIPLHQ